jgi:predicted O-methyltransferase YrrM
VSQPAPDELERFVVNVLRAAIRRDPEPGDVAVWVKRLKEGLTPYAMVEMVSATPEAQAFASAAPLKFPPGHFYSPVTDPVQAQAHLDGLRAMRRPLPGVRIDGDAMVALWRSLAHDYLAEQPFPDEQETGRRYWFRNPAFSYGDGAMLHCMLRRFQPKRIVEVGSGYSSACALETVERFLPEDTSLTFVEPYPQLLEDLLAAEPPRRKVEILPIPVQQAPLELFTQLEANDVLFIDSTHVLKTGSDVAFELFEVLPRLAPGVLVHIHDIGWPFEYSRKWVVEENRSWNEAYALRAFLTFNRRFDILFFNDYMRRAHSDEIERAAPWFLANCGASIWLQRR